MTKFEYKQIIFDMGLTLGQKKDDSLYEQLNELGREGWEMINFCNMTGSHYFAYVFRRPLRDGF